jgi:hypothetical protein
VTKEPAPFPTVSGTESWLKDIAHDFTLGWIGVDEFITLVMTHAFGRVPLPPEVAGILTATHLLRNAFSEDRQGIQQLATAWFTDQSPAITDPTRWHLRSVVRTPGTPSLALTGHDDVVTDITTFIGPNDRQLLASTGLHGTLCVWDPETGEQVGDTITDRHGLSEHLTAFTDSNERVLLANAGRRGPIRFWDAITGKAHEKPLVVHDKILTVLVAFTTDGGSPRLALGLSAPDSSHVEIQIWDPIARRQTGLLTGHTNQVSGITVFQGPGDRVQLASASFDGTVRIWDPGAGKQVGNTITVPGLGGLHGITSWQEDGLRLAVTTDEGMLQLLTPGTCHQQTAPLVDRNDGARAVRGPQGVLSFPGPEGILLASHGPDDLIRIWDPSTGKQMGTPLRGHLSSVRAFTALSSHSGRPLLATASIDRTVRIWDPMSCLAQRDAVPWEDADALTMETITVSDGTVLLATAGADGTIRLWDPTSGLQAAPPLHKFAALQTALTTFTDPDGKTLLASAGGDDVVHILDLETGQLNKTLVGHTEWINAIAVFHTSQGATRLVTASEDATLRIWDPFTGKQIGKPLRNHPDAMEQLATWTAPSGGPRIASAGWDGAIHVWNAETGQKLDVPFRGHTDLVTGIVPFPHCDDIRLASTSEDGTLRIWNPETGQQLHMAKLESTTQFWQIALMTAIPTRPQLITSELSGHLRIWDEHANLLHSFDLKTCLWNVVPFPDGTLGVGLDDGWAVVRVPV